MPKKFVLDTNVLLHNADSILSFADNVVVLPMSVIEELDRFKSHNDELGRNARMVIRQLDKLRNRGRLSDGVVMDNGGLLKIVIERQDKDMTGLNMTVADNRILSVAYDMSLVMVFGPAIPFFLLRAGSNIVAFAVLFPLLLGRLRPLRGASLVGGSSGSLLTVAAILLAGASAGTSAATYRIFGKLCARTIEVRTLS